MKDKIAITINGQPVDITARPEDVVSGWAVLIFTPVCSFRTIKVGTQESIETVARAVVTACHGDVDDPATTGLVVDGILSLISEEVAP